MEFDVDKRTNQNTEKYHQTDYQLSLDFTKRVYKELKSLLKGAVLFGSSAKQHEENTKKPHDIDVLLLLDDVSIVLTDKVVEAYRVITERVVSDVSERLHVTTLTLSKFWDSVRKGDPIIINIMREGVPLLDVGFFEPFQLLLKEGKVRPTPEAMWNYFTRAPASIHNAKWHVMQAMVDLYWAAIDSSHAALIKRGAVPPAPTHVPDLLRKYFLPGKVLTEQDIGLVEELYDISKQITNRDIKEISATQLDSYLQKTRTLVRKIEEFLHKTG